MIGTGGVGGTAAAGGDGGGAGAGGSTTCGWLVDRVPAAGPPAVGAGEVLLLGHSMDPAGYVFAVWYVATRVSTQEKHDLVVRMRSPGGTWTDPLIFMTGLLFEPWDRNRLTNPLYVSDGQAFVLYADGAVNPVVRASPQFPSSAVGDRTCHRPPVTWPQLGSGIQTSGGCYSVDGGVSLINSQDGLLPFSLFGMPPRPGTNPQRDSGAGTTFVLFDDTASGAPMLARNPGTGWTFRPAPSGRLMVTPGGTPVVLDVTAGAGGVILQTWAADVWTAVTIDAGGTSAGFASDAKDNIHIAYGTSVGVRYARVSAAGAITNEAVDPPAVQALASTAPGHSTEALDVRVDRNGTIRIFDGATIFTRCAPDPDWAPAQPTSAASRSKAGRH
jgi:hypothetical protein